MQFTDTVMLERARRTGDGYLVAHAKIARTGIQLYSGAEMERPEMAVVRVYRPAEELFAADALTSWAHKPFTNGHPPNLVTADNWKKHSIGQVGGEVSHDSKFVYVPLLMMDAAAIGDYERGKRELSGGYTADISWEAGVTPDGEPYDAIMRKPRGNHVALVDAARGGKELRLGDGDPATEPTLKTMVIDGIEIAMTDQGAEIVGTLQRQLADANEAAAARAQADAAEIATLKTRLAESVPTPQSLRDAARSYAQTVACARKLAPNAVLADTMDEAAIRKLVVTARLGDAAKDWTEAQFETSFRTLAAGLANAPADALRATLAGGLVPRIAVADATAADKAWEASVHDINAWRKSA